MAEELIKNENPNPQREPKEIIIKLNKKKIIQGSYILLIIALLAVIGIQHYYKCIVPCNCNSGIGSATKMIIETNTLNSTEENETDNETEVENVEEETINTTNSSNAEKKALLPITGDITVTINKINYVIKGDDYARVTSVDFTIVNQKEGFIPTVKGYLVQYGTDDSRDITLSLLKAGESIRETSSKLNIGYNKIDNAHTLKLQVYDGQKYLAGTSKTFTTK